MPELEIYGDIGEDWWDPANDITAKSVSRWLRENASGAQQITVRINSYGGWVSEGVAIRNILKSHKARVVCIVDGFALSAASVIATAGDEIHMGQGAMQMIHNASGGARGTADVLESTAQALRKMSDSIAALYAERTGKPKEECQAMMDAETWLTADECLALGFCDKVITSPAASAPKRTASARASNHASPWLNTYRNVPASMLHLLAEERRPPQERPRRDVKPDNFTPAARSPLGELARPRAHARIGDL